MGNDVACNIEGIGSIKLKLSNGKTKILSEVRFVSGIKLGTLLNSLMISKEGSGSIP